MSRERSFANDIIDETEDPADGGVMTIIVNDSLVEVAFWWDVLLKMGPGKAGATGGKADE